MIKPITTPLLLLILLMLSACGDQQVVEVNTESGSPEQAAIQFFTTIYNDKDLEKTKQYATPKIQRILKGHGSLSGVTRNMLNMQFDQVEVEVEKGRNLRESYDNDATISLIFTGRYNGNKVTDTRTVKLLRQNGKWLISEIKADPYAR